MSTLFESLFGTAPVKQEGTAVSIDPQYDAIANNYGASLHKSMQHTLSTAAQSVLGANAAEPHPEDDPSMAVSIDAAYDLWAAKYGYEWVRPAASNWQTVATGQGPRPGWLNPRTVYGTPVLQTQTPTVSAQITPPAPEPEFDWYTVARRLANVRAMEMHGAYFRLVPREWCK